MTHLTIPVTDQIRQALETVPDHGLDQHLIPTSLASPNIGLELEAIHVLLLALKAAHRSAVILESIPPPPHMQVSAGVPRRNS